MRTKRPTTTMSGRRKVLSVEAREVPLVVAVGAPLGVGVSIIDSHSICEV
jgi:hypothetical protein